MNRLSIESLENPRPREGTALRICAAFVLLSGAACRSTPPPEPVPLALPGGVTIAVEHHAGSLIGGSVHFDETKELDADPRDAWRVRARLLYLDRMPPGEFTKLSTTAELVATPTDVEPLRASEVVGRGARTATGEQALELLESIHAGAAGRLYEAQALTTALPPGITASLSLANAVSIDDPDNFLREWAPRPPVEQALELQLSRAGSQQDPGELSFAIIMQGLAPRRGSSTSDLRAGAEELPSAQRLRSQRPGAPVTQREVVVPGHGLAPGAGIVVFLLPSPFGSSPHGDRRTFCAVVEVEQAPAPDAPAEELEAHRLALERCLEQTREAAARAARNARPVRADAVERRSLDIAMRALAEEEGLRPTLVYLAEMTSAALLADLALDADSWVLDELRANLIEAREALGVEETSARELGWCLEAAAFRFLAERAMKRELEPEFDGLLLRHVGEVGRYPSILQDLLARAVDQESFEQALIAEQEFFLEDANPASRVRAFDWLVARDAAPQGFDPLGAEDERRASLTRVRRVREAAASIVEEAP
jgi:hypothetical protein